ncbi:MAG: type II toxin-antitoxin system VapC family toxin [Mycobacterium sp.]|uniref:type II toxin-antitoxin system VapC family toxin n=1 Tax=Mycobacterium sp. TaxID=1785 RepID=UPI001EC1868D|nr:type II toxin-antitoxin system VapC family toxin [Mycobacterium sp.]MBW0018955.1 type II toxin-antitoxin system VapC family toxin [Mycobacterium sp.]
MIVLDTTVLVYAKGVEHPLRQPCRDLIAAIAEERIEATTTAEVIQEFVHVRARRRERSDAAALGRDYVELLSPLLMITGENLRRGLALFQTTPRLGAFGAVLAATAAKAGASALVSADTAFADLSDIAYVIPDAAGIATLFDSS